MYFFLDKRPQQIWLYQIYLCQDLHSKKYFFFNFFIMV